MRNGGRGREVESLEESIRDGAAPGIRAIRRVRKRPKRAQPHNLSISVSQGEIGLRIGILPGFAAGSYVALVQSPEQRDIHTASEEKGEPPSVARRCTARAGRG